jgi:4-hydroxy-4-methyl-2-oxoglutarate aldolase
VNISKEIIDFCFDNRISTTEVSDALGKVEPFSKVMPINKGKYSVGAVRCIFTAHNSNYAVHEQIIEVKKGDVVIIFTHDCKERAIIGDVISKYTLLYRGAAAIVVEGMVRDLARLYREDYPIWSNGTTPVGCFNKPSEAYPADLETKIRSQLEGGIAVADDGGVVIIPPDRMNKDTLERLKRIEMQESIWYYCLDVLKWDTKKIVCDKSYLDNPTELSNTQSEITKFLNKPLD